MSSRSRRFPRHGARKAGTIGILYIILCLFASSTTVSLEKPAAAFIETHLEDQLSLEDYWHAAVSFRQIGFVANLLSPYTGVQRIHPDNLTNYVSVLLITPRDSLSMGNDIDFIAQYVEGGGGLIIAGQSGTRQYESWARDAVNELTTLFGIEFQRDLVCDPDSTYLSDPRYPHWPTLRNFADHESVEGLDAVSYHSGCSLKIFNNATAVAWTSDNGWSDLDGNLEYTEDEDVGQRVVAAIATYGKGRVACIGDNNLWSSRFLDGFDNNEMLLSLLEWVSMEVVQPDLRIAPLDLSPHITLEDDGNYTTRIPLRIWNQGNAPVDNVTVYLGSGEAEFVGINLTFRDIQPGQIMNAEVELRLRALDCRHISLGAEIYEEGSLRILTIPTIRLTHDYDLAHLNAIFSNYTEVVYGWGGWGNYTELEMEIWANETMDRIADNEFEWEVLNHTEVASKTAGSYSIKSVHHRRNIVAIGDPDSNYVSGYVSQKGDLRILGNRTSPVLPQQVPSQLESSEEMLTSIPRLDGDLSEWGYLSLMCEETFRERSDNRLAVGGFGRRGMETALQVLWEILDDEVGGYREELSGTFALFRGIYEGDQLVGLEFE
jgi:hypothetical protein